VLLSEADISETTAAFGSYGVQSPRPIGGKGRWGVNASRSRRSSHRPVAVSTASELPAIAAGRGLSVPVVREGRSAQGTSSRSGKLVHGGLRYLEYYEFRLVREA